MARFVSFPGTAGSYAQTDDVNLIPDADTANMQQSIGIWINQNNATPTLDTPVIPAKFGTTAIKATSAGSATISELRAPVIPTVDATEYTASVWFLPTMASLEGRIRLTGSSTAFTSFIPLPAGVFTQIPITFTTSGTSLDISPGFQIAGGGTVPAGEVGFISALSMRLGTSPLFLPSLRIVGDLDYRFDLDADWETATDMATAYIDQEAICNLRTSQRFGMSFAGSAFTSLTHGFTGTNRRSIRIKAEPDVGFTVQQDTGSGFQDVVTGGVPWAPVAVPGNLTVGDKVSSIVPLTGDIYSLSLRDGIGGPIVAVFDPDDIVI